MLAGRINPSGKLSETFPARMHVDLGMVGNDLVLEYNKSGAWATATTTCTRSKSGFPSA